MYTYRQSTGELRGAGGELLTTGYAGHAEGKNAPAFDHVKNVGPLPRGLYILGRTVNHPVLGPLTIDLVPDAHNVMYGRCDFRVHGDSKTHPGEASNGCVVAEYNARRTLSDSPDRWLAVVE